MGLSASNDTYIPGLSMMAEAIRDHGAPRRHAVITSRTRYRFCGGTEVVSASRITFEPWYEAGAELPRELTIEEIYTLIRQYGEAAARVRRAGFDLVEIMAAAGCLPHQFSLSPRQSAHRYVWRKPAQPDAFSDRNCPQHSENCGERFPDQRKTQHG